jgi:hypothetical protein
MIDSARSLSISTVLLAGDYLAKVHRDIPCWSWDPKPFRGNYSDDVELANHLWRCGIEEWSHEHMFQPYTLRALPALAAASVDWPPTMHAAHSPTHVVGTPIATSIVAVPIISHSLFHLTFMD